MEEVLYIEFSKFTLDKPVVAMIHFQINLPFFFFQAKFLVDGTPEVLKLTADNKAGISQVAEKECIKKAPLGKR